MTIQQCFTPVTEGDNVTLYYNATGNPVPSTAWVRAGKVVTYNKKIVLTAVKGNESGRYKCLGMALETTAPSSAQLKYNVSCIY